MPSELSFFDTHAHLPMLKHDELTTVVSRARDAGIHQMVTVATEQANWDASENCARQFSHISYSLGLHPHSAKEWAGSKQDLENRLKKRDPKCVAVGEIGLDFYYGYAPKEDQLESLEGQLRLAKHFELPIIVHCREAFEDFFTLVKNVGLSPAGGVMHCFTGSTPNAKDALDLGMMISFSGILTFKNAADLRATAKVLPLASTVIETDCPFLAPLSKRGKPNEPAFMTETAQTLADLHGVSLQEIAEATTANAQRLFRLPAQKQ